MYVYLKLDKDQNIIQIEMTDVDKESLEDNQYKLTFSNYTDNVSGFVRYDPETGLGYNPTDQGDSNVDEPEITQDPFITEINSKLDMIMGHLGLVRNNPKI